MLISPARDHSTVHQQWPELGESGSLWSEDDSVGPFQTLTTLVPKVVLFGSLSYTW